MFKLTVPQYEALQNATQEEAEVLAKAFVSNPLKYFVPNGAQEKVIKEIVDVQKESNIPIVLFTFANGVGKTLIASNILAEFTSDEIHNGWFDYPIFHNFPYPKMIWYCSTGEAIKNTVVPELLRILPEGTYETFKDGKPHVSRIEFNNGWKVAFKTYDQSPESYESANVGMIIADEPMPENLWKAVKSRRRMGCITLLPMTPLYTPPYILDEIQKSAENNIPGYRHLTATVYEASKDPKVGIRGHLEPDIIDEMVAGYDPEERKARAEGLFQYFSNRIVTVERNIHLVDPEDYPIPAGSVYKQIVDPHDGRPACSIWMAVTPEGRIIIFDEYPIDKSRPFWQMKEQIPIIDIIRDFVSIENYWNLNSPRRVIDKRFGFQTRGGTTLANEYRKAGRKIANEQFINKSFIYNKSYSVQGIEGELQYGHNRMREALLPMNDGKPGLVIYNTCYHTWNGMSHYVRKHETTKASMDKASSDGKIIEKFKDFPDVVRYGVCDDVTKTYQSKKKKYSMKNMLGRSRRGYI